MANPAEPTATPNADQAAPAAPNAELSGAKQAKQKKSISDILAGLSKREKAIASVAGFVLIIFVLYFVLFRPLGQHLGGLSKTIHEKEALIPKKLAVINDKALIEKTHEELAGYSTDAKISSEEEIAAYLGEIERVSQRVGLFISNINPVQTEEAEGGYWLKVDVEGAGSVANIKKFISGIEEANPSVRVSGMSIRGQGPSTDELRFRFSVIKLGLKQAA
jgi:hypothetical protein